MTPKELLQNINKEEFYTYYKVHTISDTANKFQITKEDAISLVHHLHITKTSEEKRQSIDNFPGGREAFYKKREEVSNKSKIDRYGSIEEYNKIVKQRQYEGKIKKYGSIEAFNSFVHEKTTEAMLEKYGVDNAYKIPCIQIKKNKTMVEHYGSLENAYKIRNSNTANTLLNTTGYSHNMYNPEVREKVRKTFIEKYGVDTPFKSKEIQNKIQKKIMDKYGVEYACLINGFDSGETNSKINKFFANILQENNVEYQEEFTVGKFRYDFRVKQFLIELNPYATHNVDWSPYGNRKGLNEDYHSKKSINAYKNGYICLMVFDWTNIVKVLELIKSNSEITVRFSQPRHFIYNYKLKALSNNFSNNCVNIFDDGGDIYVDNILYRF